MFAYPWLNREPNFEAIQEHLARCHASGTHTALKGIYRLKQGAMLKWRSSNHSFQIKPFGNIEFWNNSQKTYNEAVESIRAAIRAAVKNFHLRGVTYTSEVEL